MDHLQIYWILWSGMWSGLALFFYFNLRDTRRDLQNTRRIITQARAAEMDERCRADTLKTLVADREQEVARLRKCGEDSYRHQRELETMLDAIRAIVVSPTDGTRYMAVELVPKEDDE
jgi:hypothetical protein